MKKVIVMILMLTMLTGCAGGGTFEGVEDVYGPSGVKEAGKIGLELPEDAASHVLAGQTGQMYFCDGYEISVETLASGDLDRTLLSLTGYHRDALTVIETANGDLKRYDCVWTAAGEDGDQVGKAVVLDDGSYHYCVSVMAHSREAGSLQSAWQSLLASVTVSY